MIDDIFLDTSTIIAIQLELCVLLILMFFNKTPLKVSGHTALLTIKTNIVFTHVMSIISR